MYQGSCLCGQIQYQVNKFIGAFYFCHCSQCRKETGSSFGSNASVQTRDFLITQGEAHLKDYRNEKYRRTFCDECGSHIYAQLISNPGILRLRMGTLNTPLDHAIEPVGHVFVDSKAEWTTFCDDLPKYPERPQAS